MFLASVFTVTNQGSQYLQDQLEGSSGALVSAAGTELQVACNHGCADTVSHPRSHLASPPSFGRFVCALACISGATGYTEK